MRRFRRLALLAALFLFSALTPALAGEGPLVLDKAYIKESTTLSGEVILRGQCVVRRGATLTLLPGTVLRFDWTDEDNNNVGDGELTVEGRLIARGTKEKPILFTSNRPNPAQKDWTFVQISVSKDSVVQWCVFEYAFSGLQVHYSTATISDSIFRNNFEGIRFSTTDILIEHNDIVNNFYGIRCEANGSRTTVTKNRLDGNDNGFFPVRKTWETVKVFDNNITNSKSYQVTLGQTQNQDLDLTRNWWGTTDPTAIASSLFDKAYDPALGKVLFEPFLTAPVADAGRR